MAKRKKKTGSFWLRLPSIVRLGIAALVGIGVAVAIGEAVSWRYAPLAFWDITSLIAISGIWLSIRKMDASETKDHATNDDPGRAYIGAIMLCASIASLASVLVLIIHASSAKGITQVLDVGLGIASVVISWTLVHIIYTLRYADLYFEYDGAIDFNSKEPPTYQDFAYVAFTIGMTYQVSDTSFSCSEIRTAARQHALLSYVFGTAIIATVINTIAGLGK